MMDVFNFNFKMSFIENTLVHIFLDNTFNTRISNQDQLEITLKQFPNYVLALYTNNNNEVVAFSNDRSSDFGSSGLTSTYFINSISTVDNIYIYTYLSDEISEVIDSYISISDAIKLNPGMNLLLGNRPFSHQDYIEFGQLVSAKLCKMIIQ